MITKDEILAVIIKTVHECVPETRNMNLNEKSIINVGVSSMEFAMIICRLEDRFNIKIPTKKWVRLYDFSDLVDLIDITLQKAK